MERGKHFNGRFFLRWTAEPSQLSRVWSQAAIRCHATLPLGRYSGGHKASGGLRSGPLQQGRSRKHIGLLGANAGEADFIYYRLYIIHPPPLFATMSTRSVNPFRWSRWTFVRVLRGACQLIKGWRQLHPSPHISFLSETGPVGTFPSSVKSEQRLQLQGPPVGAELVPNLPNSTLT